MKKTFCILVLLLLGAGCSRLDKKASVSGIIRTELPTPPERYFVGLYPLSLKNRGYIGEPVVFEELSNPEFSLRAYPGKYILVVYALETETMKDYLLLPDSKTAITMEIELPRRGVDEDIESVLLIGDFCGWDVTKGRALSAVEGVWRLGEHGLREGDAYNFVVNGHAVFDVANKEVEAVKRGAGLNNRYSGGDIVFDPSLYRQPRVQPIMDMHGFDMHDALLALMEDFDGFDRERAGKLVVQGISQLPDYEAAFTALLASLDRMESGYDASFRQAFLEKRMEMLLDQHPVKFELGILNQLGRPDSVLLRQVYTGRRFQNFFSSLLDQMRALDPGSVFLEGDWAGAMLQYGDFPSREPSFQKKYELYDGFFYDFILDCVRRSPYRIPCAQMLYETGSFYAMRQDAGKAGNAIRLLVSRYPDQPVVTGGLARKVLTHIKRGMDSRAPDFTVQTLTGDTLSLSGLRGRFIFLDFWGSWCAPCRIEIPHVKELARSFSPDTLQVVGLASDDSVLLSRYIEEQAISFPNAIAPESVLSDYGITAYPTTFLIDPEGVICDTGLRGIDLVLQVRKKIESHRASR